MIEILIGLISQVLSDKVQKPVILAEMSGYLNNCALKLNALNNVLGLN